MFVTRNPLFCLRKVLFFWPRWPNLQKDYSEAIFHFLPVGTFNFFILQVSQFRKNIKKKKYITLSLLYPHIDSLIYFSALLHSQHLELPNFSSLPLFHYWNCSGECHRGPPHWPGQEALFSSCLTWSLWSVWHLVMLPSWHSRHLWFLWPGPVVSLPTRFSVHLFLSRLLMGFLFFLPASWCLPGFCFSLLVVLFIFSK